MLSKGCYAYQLLDNVDMYKYANFIKIYHAVQDLLAFSLTVDERTDRRALLAKMMFDEASSSICIPLIGQC